MNQETHHLLLYQRAREIQPHLIELAHEFKSLGMTPEEINIELCFALLHEGYNLRDIIPNKIKKTIAVITSDDNFWEEQRDRFQKSIVSPLVADNKNNMEFKNGFKILRYTPEKFELESCSYEFDEIIRSS